MKGVFIMDNNNMYNNNNDTNNNNNNVSYNNAAYNNAGYNNAGYNNAGYNNAGYNNAGYNNMGYNIPEEYRPISMWGYLGYQILFSIPILGFILLIVFSVGGSRNINLRNFARSYFCYLIIIVVLAVLIAAGGVGAAIFS